MRTSNTKPVQPPVATVVGYHPQTARDRPHRVVHIDCSCIVVPCAIAGRRWIGAEVCYRPDKRGAVHICNLHNIGTNLESSRKSVPITHDTIGNLEPSLDIFPDRAAPAMRDISGRRAPARLTWEMPIPLSSLRHRSAALRICEGSGSSTGGNRPTSTTAVPCPQRLSPNMERFPLPDSAPRIGERTPVQAS